MYQLLPKYIDVPEAIQAKFWRWNVKMHPRISNLAEYIERHRLTVTKIEYWNDEYRDTILYRIDGHGVDSPCGESHSSNESVILYTLDANIFHPNLLDLQTRRVQTCFPVNIGRLTHNCLDPDCKGAKKIEIQYMSQCAPWNCVTNVLPFDFISQILCRTNSNMKDNFISLVSLLFGYCAPYCKIRLVRKGELVALWTGFIWKIVSLQSFAHHFSKAFHRFLAGIKKQFTDFPYKHESAYGPVYDRMLQKFEQFSGEYELKLLTLDIARKCFPLVEETLFDGISSRGIIATIKQYIDLRTGHEIRPDPDLFISTFIPYTGHLDLYRPRADRFKDIIKFWTVFFRSIKETERLEIIQSLQKYFGYALTGQESNQLVLSLIGNGRNGKGVITRILLAAMNFEESHIPQYHPFSDIHSSESEQQPKSVESMFMSVLAEHNREDSYLFNCNLSLQGEARAVKSIHDLAVTIDRKYQSRKTLSSESGHTAGLVKLIGARLVHIDEINEDEQINYSFFKRLSGGDQIDLRVPYEQNMSSLTSPMHTVLCVCNVVPRFLIQDSIKDRLRILRLPMHFVADPDPKNESEMPMDPTFEERHIEDSLFMNRLREWLLLGAINFYQQDKEKLRFCSYIENETSSYWKQFEAVPRFLEERCKIDPEDSNLEYESQKLRKDFNTFTKINHIEVPGQMAVLDKQLLKMGIQKKRKRVVDGTRPYVWCGIASRQQENSRLFERLG